MAFSRAAAARHPLESRWSVFADVYQTLLGAVVLLSYAGALLYGIREELLVNAGSLLTRSVISDRFAQVPAQTAMAAVLLLAAAGGFLLLLRLGPVSATAAQGIGGWACRLTGGGPWPGRQRAGCSEQPWWPVLFSSRWRRWRGPRTGRPRCCWAAPRPRPSALRSTWRQRLPRLRQGSRRQPGLPG